MEGQNNGYDVQASRSAQIVGEGQTITARAGSSPGWLELIPSVEGSESWVIAHEGSGSAPTT